MIVNQTTVLASKGDITREAVDAIVNAANTSLLGGGGVDGAIHRAGGPAILEACKVIRSKQGGCPTGEAVITPAGNLPARYVIHTVGPVYQGGMDGEPELLRRAYANSLALATRHGIRTIAFPSISTGVYGYPIEEAAAIAIATVKEFAAGDTSLKELRFILFSDHDLAVYEDLLTSGI